MMAHRVRKCSLHQIYMKLYEDRLCPQIVEERRNITYCISKNIMFLLVFWDYLKQLTDVQDGQKGQTFGGTF